MLINELVTKLSFKQDNGLAAYERSLQNAQKSSKRAAEAIERNMTGAAATIHKLLKFNVDVKTKRAEMQVKSLEKVFHGLKSVAMVGFGAIGAGAMGAGVVGKQILDVGTTYERLQAALTTATGSQAAGAQAYKEIEQFAKKTPYDLNQVADAFIKLKNLGLDPSQAALTSYGNTAGAMGKSLNQMIEAVADASTGEFERLKEFGIKSKQEGDKVTFTFRGVNTTVSKDAKEIQKYLLDLGNTKFAGGMALQSNTIGGMTSTLSDNFQALGRAIWTGGFGDAAKSVVKWLTDLTDKMQPIIEKQVPIFIKDMQKLALDVLPKIKPIVEGITAALVGMGGAYAYFKVIAVLDFMTKLVVAWRAMDVAMKAAAISGALANATIMFIPMLIAAAVGAVAWFGWQVYKYITQGTDSLTWMGDKFKWLQDLIMLVGEVIKTWWPILVYTAKVITGILMLAWDGFWIAVQFAYDHTLKPVFDGIAGALQWVWNLIKSVTVENENWNAGVSALWEGWKGFLNWLQPVLEWVSNTVGGITGSIGNWTNALSNLPGFGGGNQETSPTVSGGSLDASGLGFNQSMASKMVQSIRMVQTASGRCLNAVWQGQQRALGGKSPITAYHAADSAAQLSKSAMFREITGVTPEMLKDPKFMKMLHGATVIYNRNAGFSKVSGHAEIWDMVTKTAQFGRGNVALNRNAHQLRNARIFIPVSSGGGGGAVNINSLVINVPKTNATPAQIQKSVTDGTSKALNKANQQNRQARPAGAVQG